MMINPSALSLLDNLISSSLLGVVKDNMKIVRLIKDMLRHPKPYIKDNVQEHVYKKALDGAPCNPQGDRFFFGHDYDREEMRSAPATCLFILDGLNT